MIELVRKRHEGDGWLVFEEVGDKPGLMRDRTADAIALGVWASKKYEAHLYEFKISREDVKREIRDPSKVEGVGKYCTYWWMAISDVKIINELIIPEAWGIVVKKPWGKDGEFRLHTIRKAPRQKPQPIGVMFAVSLIRNMAKNYINPSVHKKLTDELEALKYGPTSDVESEKDRLERKVINLERDMRRMTEMVERFEKNSGVKLGEPSWEYGNIGEAVRVALDMRERIDIGAIGGDIATLSTAAAELERRAKAIAEGAVALRGLVGMTEHTDKCRSNPRHSWSRGQCNCGAIPLSEVEKKLAANAPLTSSSGTPTLAVDCVYCRPDAFCAYHKPADPTSPTPFTFGPDDGEGSGGDSGRAGAHEQDAGRELRDQRAEVPHGESTP